ncbi:MAG TPA: alpha/beta hydrolase [Actinomycetes bacterium]|nr:alpha/beta hydrolase [Actinomycetes bacterium]
MIERDLTLRDGRTLHVYDTGAELADARLVVVWHHGTPNIGPPPAPLLAESARLGVRWLGFDRPGYGGSTRHPGRTTGTVALDVAELADALSVERFAVVGHSGGGSHAVACGAALGDRVAAVVSMAGLAPYRSGGLDWYAGMVPSGVASLRAASEGREAKEAFEASGAEYDPEFTPADLAALKGEWSWLGSVVGPAVASGPAGLVDDDLSYVAPWGVEPSDVAGPVLLLHGEQDGVVPAAHSRWLAEHCPTAQLRLLADDGHISVLTHASDALEWLVSEPVG